MGNSGMYWLDVSEFPARARRKLDKAFSLALKMVRV
jgi:hypothetical protein